MAALIFDLDGTLVDSVYAHVLAWQLAFAEAGIPIEGWRLHRRMGMSGGLFKRAVMRELGRTISLQRLQKLDHQHAELFRQFPGCRRTFEIPAKKENQTRHCDVKPATAPYLLVKGVGRRQRNGRR